MPVLMLRGAGAAVVSLILLQTCSYILCQQLGNAWYCRGSNPKAAVPYCGLPYAATNSYGWFRCEDAIKVGRPKNTQEVLKLLQAHPKVKGAGVGHSWWKEQACSGNSSEAINIVLTEFPEVLALSQRLPETYSPFSQKDIAEVPIQVNEDELTVRVAGGVGQRVLLDWLAAYKTQKSPTGYVLLAFAQYIDQTIAGAIATGTHGSTLSDGSISSQIVSLDLAIANGTLITITPASNPHLWRAVQISVGRLGIITSAVVKMRRNLPVQRSLLKTDFGSLAAKIKGVQQAYNAAATSADKAAALAPLHLLQCTWYMRSNQLWEVSFNPLGPEALANATFASALQQATDAMTGVKELSVAKATAKSAVLLAKEEAVASSIDSSTTDDTGGGGYKQVTDAVKLKPDIGFDLLSAANIGEPLAEAVFYALSDYPATLLAREAYVAANEIQSQIYSGVMPLGNSMAQYELAIPIERAGDCFSKINEFVYVNKSIDLAAFTYFSQVRYLNEETAYISAANGGPRVFLNLEDHNSFNAPKGPVINTDFQKLVKFVKDTCNPRFHWGKAGWPRYFSCYDGSTYFPETWCDFGCAVEELDPFGKFSSESNVWKWRATTTSGVDVPFVSCCTPQGFDKSKCTCAPRTDCVQGPPQPCTAEC